MNLLVWIVDGIQKHLICCLGTFHNINEKYAACKNFTDTVFQKRHTWMKFAYGSDDTLVLVTGRHDGHCDATGRLFVSICPFVRNSN